MGRRLLHEGYYMQRALLKFQKKNQQKTKKANPPVPALRGGQQGSVKPPQSGDTENIQPKRETPKVGAI